MGPDDSAAPDLSTLSGDAPERLEQAAGAPRPPRRWKDPRQRRAHGGRWRRRTKRRPRARKFADALVAELDAPRRRVERVSFQRWWRIGAVVTVLLLIGYGARALMLGRNLAANNRFEPARATPAATPAAR